MQRRVVITGIGIHSCIGKNISEVTKSLKEGKSGIGIDPVRKNRDSDSVMICEELKRTLGLRKIRITDMYLVKVLCVIPSTILYTKTAVPISPKKLI